MNERLSAGQVIDWDDFLEKAKPVIEFIGRPIFFNRPFGGAGCDAVVMNGEASFHRYMDSICEKEAEDWQLLLDRESRGAYSLPRSVERKILGLLAEGLSMEKNYSGISEKFLNDMEGDMYRLLCCHASGELPELWKKVQAIYLEDGIPCGWRGAYPQGQILIYSNSPSANSIE